MASSSQDKRMVDVIGSEEPGLMVSLNNQLHTRSTYQANEILRAGRVGNAQCPVPRDKPPALPWTPGAGSSSHRSRIYIRETPGDGPAIQKSQILRRIPQVLYESTLRYFVFCVWVEHWPPCALWGQNRWDERWKKEEGRVALFDTSAAQETLMDLLCTHHAFS
ncbi:hypothetical protein I7I51_04803 [Histoplasma capsulatum]|uniref:Uncharacterized protein n=1 Tax=Ajellomyces capsulatus TaxID=5037 RepID=A0A8A1M732_AJECA|nr:hypothetical protein I7I51_04803 [Histoplasma capsulatum]